VLTQVLRIGVRNKEPARRMATGSVIGAKQSHQWAGARIGPGRGAAANLGPKLQPSVLSVATLSKLLAPLKVAGTRSRPVVASLIVLLSTVGV
jgi:hypothetical protein